MRRLHRGTGVLPVVHGLKMLPGGREMVPEALRHYLETPVAVADWYPEADYETLIQILASLIPPRSVGGDVWAYFGRTAAQRDLAGLQEALAPAARMQSVGAYRRLAEGARGVLGLALRTMKLWGLYHDAGELVAFRKEDAPGILVVQIRRFSFPCDGLVDLQLAYMAEFGRLVGVRMEGRVTQSTVRGDPVCEYEFRVEPTPENLASLAKLPAV
ncbi:MAG TPA: hypothetical protein VHE30_20800 [Polyangiaceae bacterium]|nr:hypothetical protein [Polyangiaceae bacterium]